MRRSTLSLLAVLLLAGQFLSAIHGYVHLDKHQNDHAIISIYELDNLDEYYRHQRQHQHQQNNEDEEICEICLALSGLNQLVSVAVEVSFSKLLNFRTRSLPLNVVADTAYIIPPVRAPPYLVMS